MRTIKLNSIHHLGDNIFNLILFYNMKQYIEDNDIYIDYYCKSEYHDQIKEFNCSKNIKILDYENIGLELWIGNKDFKMNWIDNREEKYDTLFLKFFNEFLEKENIPIVLENLQYSDPDLLQRYKNINTKFNDKYSDIDFLIINSTPLSTQYDKNEEEWNRLIYKLNNKYKIVTTQKVEDVNCTYDDKLTIKDIAAISTSAKKIIAVNSGVVPGLFNIYTLNNIEVMYYFDKNFYYENPKFIKPKNNDINELYNILNIDIVEKFETINDSTSFTNYLLLLFFFIILLFIFFNYKYYKKIMNYIKKYIILIILVILILFFYFNTKKEYFVDETNKTEDIKIFITHYTKLVDRKQHVLDIFNKNNIKNYEFIENYNQEDISDNDKNRFVPNFKMSAMSLFLKHIFIYREISISNKYSHALIFEDDIFLDDDFVNILNKYIVELPQDYDMLFIGNCSNLHIDENLLTNDKHIYEKSNEKTNLNGSSKCCDSYLVSKKCAIKLCEYMDNLKDKIELPIDHWINDVSRHYNFKVYWAEPTIVSQGSLDGRFQSSII